MLIRQELIAAISTKQKTSPFSVEIYADMVYNEQNPKILNEGDDICAVTF
jgi:hypothetical protein